MELRYLEYSDLEKVAEVTAKSWHATYSKVLPTDLVAIADATLFHQRWTTLLANPPTKLTCLVLENEGSIVGVGACSQYRIKDSPLDSQTAPLVANSEFGEFFRGYTDPASKHNIEAKYLFNGCIHSLADNSFQMAGLWTNSRNSKMIRFCEYLGGDIIAYRPAHVLGQDIPEHQEVFCTFNITELSQRIARPQIHGDRNAITRPPMPALPSAEQLMMPPQQPHLARDLELLSNDFCYTRMPA